MLLKTLVLVESHLLLGCSSSTDSSSNAGPVNPVTLIDRYITREIFKVFIAIIVILMLVLVGGSFVKLLQLAAQGDIANEVVFNLLGLEILRLGGRLIPPAFFFATLFVLGRMYRDNEMMVLATAGIGPARIYRLVMLLALPMTLVTVWLSVFLYPSISYLTNRIKLEQKDAVIVAAMDAGRFIESNRGYIVLYAESRSEDKSTLTNLFVQHREKGKVAIATAARGSHHRDEESGLRVVTMDDGLRYEGNIGKPEMTVVEFGDYSMWINPADTTDIRKRYSTWATSALWQEQSLKASAELQNRFSYPLALIAFALLAVPLSRSMPREGVYGRIVLAILVYLMASGLGQVASTWMLKGVTPRWMGTWWVVALMLMLALFLARRDLANGLRGRDRPA